MNEILAVASEAMTVTVQPGVVWERLEKNDALPVPTTPTGHDAQGDADMLDAVGERIPMPEAMENLMPKMLPEVIPYFVTRMEAYLRGEPMNGH